MATGTVCAMYYADCFINVSCILCVRVLVDDCDGCDCFFLAISTIPLFPLNILKFRTSPVKLISKFEILMRNLKY